MGKLISAQEAAHRLGISFWTIYRWARTGRLASIRLGRRRLFSEEDLEELVRRARQRSLSNPDAEQLGRDRKE